MEPQTTVELIDRIKNTGGNVADHFRGVTKMVNIGSGAARTVKDYVLTRYACYLIAQNEDSKKNEIAFLGKDICAEDSAYSVFTLAKSRK